MAIYYFDLHAGARHVADSVGTELPDDQAARAHACAVAHDLMRHREREARHWRLRVRKDGQYSFDLLFAKADETMNEWGADIRLSVERLCGNLASMSEAIGELSLTLLQVKATMAKADAKIHLVSVDGVRLSVP